MEALSSRLIAPSTLPLNLSLPRAYHASELAQDRWVAQIFAGRPSPPGGFLAVESGAFDGEESSNTLWLERLGWACLLVEANPLLQDAILAKHRRCHVLRGGLALSASPSRNHTVRFIAAGNVGGVSDLLGTWARHLISSTATKLSALQPGADGAPQNVSELDVPTFSLGAVLSAMRRSTIDYWSLDTEGSEPQILQAALMSSGGGGEGGRGVASAAIEIGIITVEWLPFQAKRRHIHKRLTTAEFVRVHAGDKDDYYANPRYFAARGWPMPRPPAFACGLAQGAGARARGRPAAIAPIEAPAAQCQHKLRITRTAEVYGGDARPMDRLWLRGSIGVFEPWWHLARAEDEARDGIPSNASSSDRDRAPHRSRRLPPPPPPSPSPTPSPPPPTPVDSWTRYLGTNCHGDMNISHNTSWSSRSASNTHGALTWFAGRERMANAASCVEKCAQFAMCSAASLRAFPYARHVGSKFECRLVKMTTFSSGGNHTLSLAHCERGAMMAKYETFVKPRAWLAQA